MVQWYKIILMEHINLFFYNADEIIMMTIYHTFI